MLALILSIADPEKRDMVMDLYLNYRQKCLAIAWQYTQDQGLAEDLVHDVFAEIVNRPSLLKYDTAQKNWPYVAVMIKNKGKNHARDNKRLRFVDDYADIELAAQAQREEVDLAALLATRESFQQAVEAVMALSDTYKDVILLRYDNELSDKEISELLGISITNVRVRIHRALAKLQKQLQTREGGAADGGK